MGTNYREQRSRNAQKYSLQRATDEWREDGDVDEWLAQYDIEIDLTLLPTEESGKRGPIYSGHRGGHIYLDQVSWVAAST